MQTCGDGHEEQEKRAPYNVNQATKQQAGPLQATKQAPSKQPSRPPPSNPRFLLSLVLPLDVATGVMTIFRIMRIGG